MNTAVPDTTYLSLTSTLPLTCTRAGTCCHGKTVWLNPWEIACLAEAQGTSPQLFSRQYCEFGGIRLRFNGPPGWLDLPACTLYLPGKGCSLHTGRPLSCRLYPLGRHLRGGTVQYIHRGTQFPCLDGCPDVARLPPLSVADYLCGQKVSAGETAQDAYLELMQQLADGAFALLLESGLAATGDRKTLRGWRERGNSNPDQLANHLGQEWLDRLMTPEIPGLLNDPAAFCRRHHDLLQKQAQESFGNLNDTSSVSEASVLMMSLALHLSRSLGAVPADLAHHWIATAREHGAKD